ncbi:hypothetical protein DFJ74DRAFT_683844 [Hyaloraphidium curvatum]|nr:hypothetical protein DFJ74DRAFT_683844 [Hyaloraphidium curvatum]
MWAPAVLRASPFEHPRVVDTVRASQTTPTRFLHDLPPMAASNDHPTDDTEPLACADPADDAPALPNELLSMVTEVLGRRGWKATLLEFMLACKTMFVIGLPALVRNLVLGPGNERGPEKLALLARFCDLGRGAAPCFVRRLKLLPGITLSTERLEILEKVLAGVEVLDWKCRTSILTARIWKLLRNAPNLRWLRLSLLADAARGLDDAPDFPPSVRDFTLSLNIPDFEFRRLRDMGPLREMLAENAVNLERFHCESIWLLSSRPTWIGDAGIRKKLFSVATDQMSQVKPLLGLDVPGLRIPRLVLHRADAPLDWETLLHLGVQRLEVNESDISMATAILRSWVGASALKHFVLRGYRFPTSWGAPTGWQEEVIRTKLREIALERLVILPEQPGDLDVNVSEVAFWRSVGAIWLIGEDLDVCTTEV